MLRFQNRIAALPALVFANANRDDKKQPKPFELDTFLLLKDPQQEEQPQEDNWRDLKANFRSYTEAVKKRREKWVGSQ